MQHLPHHKARRSEQLYWRWAIFTGLILGFDLFTHSSDIMLTNKAIAKVLKQTAALIDLTGGNAFRSRAFSNGARTLERTDEPAAHLSVQELTAWNGIGKGLAADIHAVVETGTLPLLDELLTAVPPGLLDVLRVKGLGAKKTRTLWQTLGVTSLDALEHAATTDQIAQLKGFGAKTQSNILDNVALLKRYEGQRRYATALGMALPIRERLRERGYPAEFSGALRRQLNVVGTLTFVVASESAAGIAAILAELLDEVTDEGDTVRGIHPDGLPVEVAVADPSRFGTMLWEHSGADAHRAAFVDAFGEPADHAEEDAVFEAAGIAVIPAALREGTHEIEAARANELPDLIHTKHLRGTLHNHSTYSDGAHTLQQMADRSRELGYSYFGICDHSRSLKVANGLSIQRVADQHEEIRTLNAGYAADGRSPFKIFAGIESDILADGSLDYPDEVLATFDFIVASVHQGFNMTEDEATRRLITAIENPHTSILG
ncbi:MAG: helix-hairpin-helix domain-containing protein, partial [Bacteroidota bacterium]